METGLQVKKNDILHSNSTRYMIMKFIGEGTFGKVVKCLNLTTAKVVAVKIIKEVKENLIENEVEMLEAVRTLDPEKNNFVRFMERFQFQNLSCLVFEMLDRNLWEVIGIRKGKPMDLNEIRPVTHQLLVALEALMKLGIVHTDLKPNNIMFVNRKDQPFKIKLIDFGQALPESRVKRGMVIQHFSYRAPEVTLGLPLSAAVDMWGVGCIMAHMYFGRSIFPDKCEYNWMKVMLHLLGQPDRWHLDSGINTWRYFTQKHDPINPGWRLRTVKEYENVTGLKPKVSRKFLRLVRNLEHAVQARQTNGNPMELVDRQAFLSLLKCCLHVNSQERITPREAMRHSFVTMVHLVDDRENRIYADIASALMTVSPLSQLDESDDSLNTEIATQDDSGKSEDSSEIYDCLNTAPTADTPKRTTSSSRDENNEHDSEKSDNWDIGSLFGSDDGDFDTLSSDLLQSSVHLSLPSFNNENDTDSEIFHSACGEPPTELFSKNNLIGPSAALDFHDGDGNTRPPSKEESDIAVFFTEDRINTTYFSVTNNAEVDPTDGAAPSISSKDGSAAVTGPTDAEEIKTSPDRAQRKPLCKRISKFFGRVKKRLISIFICGKIESDD